LTAIKSKNFTLDNQNILDNLKNIETTKREGFTGYILRLTNPGRPVWQLIRKEEDLEQERRGLCENMDMFCFFVSFSFIMFSVMQYSKGRIMGWCKAMTITVPGGDTSLPDAQSAENLKQPEAV